ncbi:glycosyltransferase family 9 protein [Roseateles amylovorans]|uniref:Uncharacterized protein n=1 Tax=Roseateles amylovorans TaxID=2978473 RepID=A0ABY6BAC7_9BURK|nr:hypothetical protein [Roseateles amylovorans]UXH80525.1 hypothetical protein N4261_11905 [Roseateles amylovorans]
MKPDDRDAEACGGSTPHSKLHPALHAAPRSSPVHLGNTLPLTASVAPLTGSMPVGDESLATERHRRWCNVRRVLLVRPDLPEQVLMSTPAFAAVRETLPWAHLTLLAAPATQALRHHLPVVDDIMSFHLPWVESGAAALAQEPPTMRGDAEMHLVRRLRRSHFDAAILFTSPAQSAFPAALVCRMAGIGLTLAHVRERAHGLLSDEVPDPSHEDARSLAREASTGWSLHREIRRQIDLVAHVGLRTADERLRLKVQSRDQTVVRQALRQAGARDGQRYVLAVLRDGAVPRSRRSPVLSAALDRLAGLGASNSASGDIVTVFLLPDASDRALTESRSAVAGDALVLATARTERWLGEFAALVEGACGVVCEEPWVAHLATALNVPSERWADQDQPEDDTVRRLSPERSLRRLLAKPALRSLLSHPEAPSQQTHARAESSSRSYPDLV